MRHYDGWKVDRTVDEQKIAIDSGGRYASGQRFQTLADEYAQFFAELRSELGDASPLPYEDFSGPYHELKKTLLDRCELLGGQLCDAGDGQVAMAGRNVVAEHVNTVNSSRAGLVQA